MSMQTSGGKPKEYVLGTGDDELARLAFQHRLWSDAAHEAWRAGRIAPGQRVLDVGCGPGYAAFDLAQLVGPGGTVVGVDESASFIEHASRQSAARNLPQATFHVGDVQTLGGIEGVGPFRSFDLAWCRWVLCFVPRPEEVVRQVAALLKPGGRFVVFDYFNYESMRIAPRGTAFAALYEKIVAATGASWRARGGDPDIVGRLPTMMHGAGLRVTHMTPHQRVAFSHETMFQWVGTWWKTFVPKLVTMGAITPDESSDFHAGWAEMEHSRDAWAMMPCVYAVIAEKVE